MVSSSESSCGGSPAFLGGGGGGVVSSAVSPRSNSPFTVTRYAGRRRSEGERERERTFQFGGFPPQREREKGFRMMPCPYVNYIVFWSKVHVWQKYVLDSKALEGP